ncbi:hypothetical protein Q4577_14875 [Marinovum sp. 2_MG-2023]|nr:hypothetical protein [Marinovum sp. 2_MG-2023]MDO6780787.1 hypothetical protein [Marinovum sp. 1_MG-2023]
MAWDTLGFRGLFRTLFRTKRSTLGETRAINPLGVDGGGLRVAVRQVRHDFVDRPRRLGDLLGATFTDAMLRPGGAQLRHPFLLQHRIALIVENLLAETSSNDPFANSVIEGARGCEGRAFLGQEVGRSVNWKVGGFQHEIPRQRKLDLRRAFLRRLILDV